MKAEIIIRHILAIVILTIILWLSFFVGKQMSGLEYMEFIQKLFSFDIYIWQELKYQSFGFWMTLSFMFLGFVFYPIK